MLWVLKKNVSMRQVFFSTQNTCLDSWIKKRRGSVGRVLTLDRRFANSRLTKGTVSDTLSAAFIILDYNLSQHD